MKLRIRFPIILVFPIELVEKADGQSNTPSGRDERVRASLRAAWSRLRGGLRTVHPAAIAVAQFVGWLLFAAVLIASAWAGARYGG
jgi:hypothetical protein